MREEKALKCEPVHDARLLTKEKPIDSAGGLGR